MNEFLFFWLACGFYFLFLVYLILTRVNSGERPFRKSLKVHFIFSLVYLVSGLILLEKFPSLKLSDLAIGVLIFYLFHYTCYTIFIGQLTRGFSVNLCVLIFERGGSCPQSDLLKKMGISEKLQSDRFDVMRESPVLKVDGDSVSLTTFGKTVVIVNNIIHRVWKLRYLGKV